ncbi:hypothetical protein Tco_1573148, partial [Tanacetum coccineum]
VSPPPKACTTPRAPVPPFSWFWFFSSGRLSPTVTGQMANSVALVAFGST